jgi:hypothetical protein
MNQKLKVSFDDPDHGWVCLTINCGDDSAAIIASYTPSDSFLDLTNALVYTGLYSFILKRNHWINLRRPSRRNPARQQCDDG